MEFFIILLAIPMGLLVGMLPAIGDSVMMIMLYPFVSHLEFNTLIAFYATMITCGQFSSSVVGLWLGLAGDVTAIPVLKERREIIDSNLLWTALYRTGQASAVATLASVAMLGMLIQFGAEFRYFLRTDVFFVILIMVVFSALGWAGNRFRTNLLLCGAGLIGSLIGYNQFLGKSILTMGVEFLVDGLPFLPVLLGIYAIPMLFAAMSDMSKMNLAAAGSVDTTQPIQLVPAAVMARGTIIGFLAGLLPLIGVTVSASTAHFVESKIKSSTALSRISSAEAADNAAVISVLFPLLVFGVAIQPSEAIVVSLLTDRGWSINQLNLDTYLKMGVGILFGVVTCLAFCVHYVTHMINWFARYHRYVFYFIFALIACDVWYLGMDSDRSVFYMIVFAISVVIGRFLYWKKIDPVPMIFVWLIGPHFWPTAYRLLQLYVL